MICPCLYPLVFIDNRNGDEVPYIAIPEEVFEEMKEITIPKFEEVTKEGFDGKKHDYMEVLWKDPKDATIKLYDVNEHIVIAGCNASTDGKKLQCKKKELYIVCHPLTEWIEHHIVGINQIYEIDKLKRFNER